MVIVTIAVSVIVMIMMMDGDDNDDENNNNIFHGRNNIPCSKNCKYRTAASLYTLGK
jgi:hypothetical protein